MYIYNMNTKTSKNSKKDAILKAAKQLFIANGFNETSMLNIATTANVSKQTIYTYFQNKENLFQELMENICAQIKCPMDDDKIFNLPAEKALNTIGVNLLTLLTSKQGIEIFRLVISESTNNPQLAKIFYQNGPAKNHTKLAKYLNSLNKLEKFNIQNPSQAADYFIAIIQGKFHLQALLNIKQPSEKEIANHVKNSVCGFINYYSRNI